MPLRQWEEVQALPRGLGDDRDVFEDFTRTRIETSETVINVVHGGSGPPVLLLHGYPQTHVMWHKVAPMLSKGYSVVAPDLRGYGDSGKPLVGDDPERFCKRRTARDQLEVMTSLGHSSFHVVGHDRGARVGYRLALDAPERVLSFTTLDVAPSQAAFEAMDSSLAYAWFHWNLMRQPAPFPETLIGSNPKFYLDFLLERWTAVEGSITEEAYTEYLRCFSDPEMIRGSCADYRAIDVDLAHDEADRGRKLDCPVLALWGGDMAKRPGWQTGRGLDMLTVWRERAEDVWGHAINCGHFLAEEAPEETAGEILRFIGGG